MLSGLPNFLKFACACALWSAVAIGVEGSARSLQQTSPVAPAPAPGSSGPPCTCSEASIFSGVSYCFALTTTPGNTNAVQASPSCKVFTPSYTCGGRIVNILPTTRTSAYPNATINGQGLQCSLNDFNSPIPAPAAPPASAGAGPCIGLPAGDYGPTATISYGRGPNNVPTPDCTVPPGTVCSIYIPISNGTAKICNSQSVENNLRG